MYNINNFSHDNIDVGITSLRKVTMSNLSTIERIGINLQVLTPSGWLNAAHCIIKRVPSQWLPSNQGLLHEKYSMDDVLTKEALSFVSLELGCKGRASDKPHTRLLNSDLYILVDIDENPDVKGSRAFLVKHLKTFIQQATHVVHDPFVVVLPSEDMNNTDDALYIPDAATVKWLQQNGFEFIEPNGCVTMYLK